MKSISKILLLIIFILISFHSNQAIQDDTSNSTIKVLFIGSSYFNFFDLPQLVTNLANSSGKNISVGRSISNGLYLSDHAVSNYTASKINEQDWDYVVLQGVGVNMAYPDVYTNIPVYPSIETLQTKIHNNCAETKIIYCLPWAFEDGMTWVQGWTDDYADMQEKIYQNTLQYSDELGFEIAPVGWAWYQVLEEKNYPLHYLHLTDWNHASLRGTYLMACVVYSTIYQESCTDVNYYAGLVEEEATYFQLVASNIVLENLELWNISAITGGINDPALPDEFILNQNYPNPFNPSTTISFTLHEQNDVKLSVYDTLGREVAQLINEEMTAGSHSINFHAENNSSGVYFYELSAGQSAQFKKMLLIK